jgi:hypothetical protein
MKASDKIIKFIRPCCIQFLGQLPYLTSMKQNTFNYSVKYIFINYLEHFLFHVTVLLQIPLRDSVLDICHKQKETSDYWV